jgi:hypothetical protein
LLNIPINTKPPQKISVAEVRMELRKIEEVMFGEVITPQSIGKLKAWIESRINIPYNIKIEVQVIHNQIKLYGLDDDAKAVLDPNCKIEYISKTR